MFIDEVTVELMAGDGGNGCMAFRREKYIEMGGPYGGNGGRGSNIIFKVDEGLNTLLDLRYRRVIKGKKGENGLGKGMQGANASDVVVMVPQGTVVTDMESGLVMADLVGKDDSFIAAYGGRGGRGNIALATRSNPAPSFCENGEPGEVKKVKVELKLLADVGLVGLPSVGKSTLISKISSAKPKIAAYHFTTITPNLGMVRASGDRSFVVADLPGLIEGASSGAGLGDKFLKHIERTRVIAHIVDMSASEGRDPYEDYLVINKELEDFDPKLLKKPQIIVANKMD
ncbi:MAG: GTPase ObgE, partial [Acholeplasmatales bacterium]|nr:GTPase ObgE [Acholeplasmatales bacterium]